MASSTKQEREGRLALVQERIGERGWSMQVMRDLAKEIGVTSRTIRQYRTEVIESLRKEITEADRDQIRAEFLDRLKGHQRQALTDGKFGPLAAMLSLEARLCGVFDEDSGEDRRDIRVVLNVPGFAEDASQS